MKKYKKFPQHRPRKTKHKWSGGTATFMDSWEYIQKSKMNTNLKMSHRFSKAPIILLPLLFQSTKY